MLKSILVLVVLFGSLTLGFYFWNESNTALNADVSVRGVFHEGRVCNGKNNCSSTPFVTFTTRNGDSATFYPFQSDLSRQQFLVAFYDESTYHDGQSVPVLYDPAHPSQALIASPMHTWLDAGFWWAVGACILLVILTRIVRQDQKKGLPPRR